MLVGCSKGQGSEADWEPTTYEMVNNLDGVAMIVKEGTVSPTKLTILFENGSNLQILYDLPFSLEKKIDGKWYQVPVLVDNDHDAFVDIGYELAPSHQRELEVDWGTLYGKIHKGEYRIVKDVLDSRLSRGYGVYDKYYLAAEFTIN